MTETERDTLRWLKRKAQMEPQRISRAERSELKRLLRKAGARW